MPDVSTGGKCSRCGKTKCVLVGMDPGPVGDWALCVRCWLEGGPRKVSEVAATEPEKDGPPKEERPRQRTKGQRQRD